MRNDKLSIIIFIYQSVCRFRPPTCRAGRTVSPTGGTVTVPAGGDASASVTLNADTPGVHSVVVSGEGVLGSATPVHVTDRTVTFKALTANFSGEWVSSVNLADGKRTDVAVGANPGEVVVSADGRTAYAANQGSDTVSGIDAADAEVTANVAVGRVPAGLALPPDGGTLWVANYTDGTVQPVDTVTLRAGTAVPKPPSPSLVPGAPDWSGGTAYVTTADGNALVPLDTAKGTAGAPLAIGAYPPAVPPTPVPVE